jgi:hypothetical protein
VWPSFHDAEVLEISLDRRGPTLEAKIHVFRMTEEIDSRGYFVLTHHTLVTLRFVEIVLQNLRWFNQQNVLSNLYIERTSGDDAELGDYKVEFGGCWGVEIDLIYAKIVLAGVEPFNLIA